MKKLTLIDKMTGANYEFPPWLRKTTIGRNQTENELVIPDREYRSSLSNEDKEIFDGVARQISRKAHFVVYQENDEVKIGSYRESGPTFLNDEPIPKDIKIPLQDKDKIRLGESYTLEIRIEEK